MIQDDRIGIRAESGKLMQIPKRYADDAKTIFSKMSNPAPTTHYLSDRYFCFLGIHQSKLDPDVEKELREICGLTEEEAPQEDNATTKVQEKKTRQGQRVTVISSK